MGLFMIKSNFLYSYISYKSKKAQNLNKFFKKIADILGPFTKEIII